MASIRAGVMTGGQMEDVNVRMSAVLFFRKGQHVAIRIQGIRHAVSPITQSEGAQFQGSGFKGTEMVIDGIPHEQI